MTTKRRADGDYYDDEEWELTRRLRRELAGLTESEARLLLEAEPACLLRGNGPLCGREDARVVVRAEEVGCRDCRERLRLPVSEVE